MKYFSAFGRLVREGRTAVILGGRGLLAALLLSGPLALAQAPTITGLSPTRNQRNAPAGSNVAVSFSQALQNTAAVQGAVRVYSQQRGGRMSGSARGTATVSGSTITFNPANNFKPGETLLVTTTTAAAATNGRTLAVGKVHQFTAAAGGTGRANFLPGSTTAGIAGQVRLATGDVDGDGDLDLVAGNANGTVSIFLNGGDATGSNTGTFSVSSSVYITNAPIVVALADMDGDGDLDLLAAYDGFGVSIVTVRLNGGNATGSNTGTFNTVYSAVAVDDGLYDLAVGDVDGDGDLDLATANAISMSVLLNGGNASGSNTGAFGGRTDIAMGYASGYLLSVAVGDVDGDGDLDLLGSSDSGRVSVCLNGGNNTGSNTGVFSGPIGTAVGSALVALALGDVDADGDLDLLTADGNTNMVRVRLNGGNAAGSNTGVFSGGSDIGVGPVRSLAVGDLDADGDLDFATANANGTVSVRLNGGNASGSSTGTFSGGYDRAVDTSLTGLALSDAEGDGDLDLLTANPINGLVRVRLNAPPAPTIASFAPTSGLVGTSVTITGTNLSSVSSVQVNGTAGTIVGTPTAGSLTFTVGTGSTTGPISVANAYGTATSTGSFTVLPLLTVTGFTPTSGPVGTVVTVTGTNLTGATAVRVNGTVGTLVGTPTASSLTFTVGSGSTTGPISVTNAYTTGTSAASFTVLPPPAIASFTPASGQLGTSVTVTGTNLDGATTVQVNGTSGSVSANNPTSLTFGVALGSTSGPITLATATGVSASAPNPVLRLQGTGSSGDNTVYLDQVEILNATGGLVSGAVGNASFETGAPAGALTNPGTAVAPWAFGSNARLSTTASTFGPPAPPDGTAHLVLLQNNGPYVEQPLSLGAGTYQVRFQLAQRQCCTAPYTAAVQVLINGVALGAALTTSSAGYVQVTSLPFTVSAAGAFTVLPTPAPTITGFTPAVGAVGTSVTLTGTNFNVFGGTTVSVNGTAGAITALTATSLTFTVAAGTTTGLIRVTTLGGTAASASNFTVVAPLVITGLSPGRNQRNAPAGSNVAVTFSQPLQNTAAVQGAVRVYSQQRGGRMSGSARGAATVSGSTITFDPANSFKPGETLLVSTTTAAAATNGLTLLKGKVHQFTAAAGGTGRANFQPGSTTAVGPGATSVVVGDVDGDGDLDLLTANLTDNTVSVRLNGGDATGSNTGTFRNGSTVQANTGLKSLALGDVDGDGDLDLVTVNQYVISNEFFTIYNNNIYVYPNGGDATGSNTGVFTFSNSYFLVSEPLNVTLGDVDGDGDLDAVMANPSQLNTMLNGGNATGSTTGSFSGNSGANAGVAAQGVVLGDVDGDGDLDAVVAANGTAVGVRLNGGDATGSNTGTFSGGSTVAVGGSPQSVALGDVDGDGDLDLLTANLTDNTVSVRLNGGDATGSNTGTFSGGSTVSVGAGPQQVVLADVDADGDLDLLTANSTTVSMRLNGGNGTGTNTGTFSGGNTLAVGTLAGLALGDVDGDGDLDLLTVNGSAVSVRLNQPFTPLPVELTRFTATAEGPAAVRLAWTTASETNSQRFEVERSADGQVFGRIGTVAAAGNSTAPRSYALLDTQLPPGPATLYYRLRQVDVDGTAAYSPVQAVATGGGPALLTAWPNPAHGQLGVRGAAAGAAVELYDATGRHLLHEAADAAGQVQLPLPASLPAGVYLIRSGRQSVRLLVE